MCGRFTLRTPLSKLVDHFRLRTQPELPFRPRYNVSPTQEVAAVRRAAEGDGREFVWLRWGLVPSWAKDPALGGRMINARSESIAEKPAFRAAFKRRRCLVAADGYYEWQAVGRRKQPYHIHLPGHEPFALAGLWESWRGAEGDGEGLLTCTLITTDANDQTRPIHDRMPVILDPSDYDLWLDAEMQDAERLQPLLHPYEGKLAFDAVSTHVNNPRNEGEACLAAAEEAPSDPPPKKKRK
jgi:putative SOS response-associated peptidase YedK